MTFNPATVAGLAGIVILLGLAIWFFGGVLDDIESRLQEIEERSTGDGK